MGFFKDASDNLTMILKGLLSRLIFFVHASLAIYFLHEATPNAKTHVCPVWYLFIPIGLLMVETCVTVFYRKGMEYTYVWPGTIFGCFKAKKIQCSEYRARARVKRKLCACRNFIALFYFYIIKKPLHVVFFDKIK